MIQSSHPFYMKCMDMEHTVGRCYKCRASLPWPCLHNVKNIITTLYTALTEEKYIHFFIYRFLSVLASSCVVRYVKVDKRKLGTVGFPFTMFSCPSPAAELPPQLSYQDRMITYSFPSILFDLYSLPDVSVQIRTCDRCSLAQVVF